MAKKHKTTKRSTSATKAKRPKTMSAKRAMSVAKSARKSVEERVAALAHVPNAVCEKDEDLQAVLDVLRNKEEAAEVRLAALQALQAASFRTVAFQSCRSDYIATLRKVAQDPDPELRQRVLGILAREKDGFVQRKLLQGLENPDKALVPPEKALQLLSYDIHAEAYPVARAIVKKPPNDTAKREALRLLSADTNSAKTFEKILRDKDEKSEIRQICAAALHALKPEKLYTHAKEILLDKSESDEIQATCLTALTQFGDGAALAKDKALLKRVRGLRKKASTAVKKYARSFLSKYDQ